MKNLIEFVIALSIVVVVTYGFLTTICNSNKAADEYAKYIIEQTK